MTPIKQQKQRYLRITENQNGRIIEAWVIEEQPQIEEKRTPNKVQKFSNLLVLSLFGWGFCGIAVGNYIFY